VAFKWAARPGRDLIKSNPALGWETPEPVKRMRRAYKAEEVAAMESGVRRWLRAIITTLAWTGMRIDELANLRWQDIDLEQRVIRIQVQDEWKPKGRRDRTVPMHPTVEAVLRLQPIGEHVFRKPRGGWITETRCLACRKADQRKLDLPVGDLHGFRRFFARR
jgi:integrase